MKTLLLQDSLVYYDDYSIENKPELQDFLQEDNLNMLLSQIARRVILVLGGDGTMLSAVQKYHQEGLPFLGINFWHKGFLLWDTSIMQESDFIEKPYPLLEAKLKIWDHKEQTFFALNEINIDAARGRIIELDIELIWKSTISLSGDGALISTPAGSTAYSRSLGWPVLPHNIPAFLITPKAPWKPQGQSPIIISQDDVISIKNTGRKNMFNIYGDGQEILTNSQDNIELIIQKSERDIHFLVGKKYEPTWDNKVLEEQGFNS